MTQEFVTLTREVVEQALEALINEGKFRKLLKPLIEKSIDSIRAAVEHPQNHVPDAGNMVPDGWKLVPVEPTKEMLLAFAAEFSVCSQSETFPTAYRAMLDAAPKPTTVKESLTVEQPQADQPAMTPIAQRKLEDLMASGHTISGYSVYHERKHQHGFVTGAGLVGWWRPEGMEYPQPRGGQGPTAEHKLKDVRCECCGYMTHHREHMGCIRVAHTKREPLTNEQVKVGLIQSIECTDARERCAFNIGVRFAERAHNIK